MGESFDGALSLYAIEKARGLSIRCGEWKRIKDVKSRGVYQGASGAFMDAPGVGL